MILSIIRDYNLLVHQVDSEYLKLRFLGPVNTETNLRLDNINSTELSISWDRSVINNCSQYHYNIFNQNCGICPNTTNLTHVTCQLCGITHQECILGVQPVICNNIVAVTTSSINITMKCKIRSM